MRTWSIYLGNIPSRQNLSKRQARLGVKLLHSVGETTARAVKVVAHVR